MGVLQYASGIEVFQLLIAVVGLSLAMWGLWLAVVDAIELADATPEDLRRLVALGNMRGQIARLSVHGILVFTGVVSVLLPPPSPGPEWVPEMEQSVIIRLGLIVVTGILVIDAVLERRQRAIFMERVGHVKHTTSAMGETQDVSVRIGGQEVAAGKVLHTMVQVPIAVVAPPDVPKPHSPENGAVTPGPGAPL